MLTENNAAIDDIKAALARHRAELHKFRKWQEEMSQYHFSLDTKVNSLSFEMRAKDARIESLEDSVAELRLMVEGM